MKKLFAYGYLTLLLAALYAFGVNAASYTIMYRETDALGIARSTKVVHICPSGCRYTSLNSACAAQTSTAANPITYYIHAGVYSGAAECSGETSATFMGEGPFSTIIDAPGVTGDNGSFEPGTSVDWTVKDIGFTNAHRAIYMDGGGTGGGNIVIQNTYVSTDDAENDEDCAFLLNPKSGTIVTWQNNLCVTSADGFTIKDGGENFSIYASGNVYRSTDGGPALTSAAYNIESEPAVLMTTGEIIDMTRTQTVGRSLRGYYFRRTNGGATAGHVQISGTVARLRINNGNGNNALVRFIETDSGVTGLGTFNSIGNDVEASTTDSTTGSVIAIYDQAAETINVIGGRYRSSGGTTLFDLHEGGAGGVINVSAVDYETESGGVTALDQTRISVSTSFDSTATMNYTTSTDGQIGVLLDNTDVAANEASPQYKACNGTSDAGEECWHWRVDSADNFEVRSATSTLIMELDNSQSGNNTVYGYTTFQDASSIGLVYVGAGATSDLHRIVFNAGTTDGELKWMDSINLFSLVNAEGLRLTGAATAPTTCSIGDLYLDTTAGAVALCLCTASNTWTAIGATGTCA